MAMSNLTKRITAGAAIYLKACGFKPLEPEVPVADGWVADLAGYVRPTKTELKRHLKLRETIGLEWEMEKRWYDWVREHFGFLFTGLVEVKISLSDFRKDTERKFKGSPPAHLSWIAYPKGMLTEQEFFGDTLFYWGRLLFSRNGSRLLNVRPPLVINSQHPGDTINFIANVGERCYNRRGYREMRQQIREFRDLEGSCHSN